MQSTIQPNWSTLATLGQSKIISTFAIWFVSVPLLAKILSYAEETLRISLFGTEITIAIALPFSLFIFYLASIFFTLGTLLFSIYCPSIIKNYSSCRDFIEKEGSSIRIKYDYGDWVESMPTEKRDDLYKKFLKEVNQKTENKDCHKDYFISEHIHEGRMADAYSFVKLSFESKRPCMRTLCMGSYIFGFILLAIVVIENIIYVLKYSYF